MYTSIITLCLPFNFPLNQLLAYWMLQNPIQDPMSCWPCFYLSIIKISKQMLITTLKSPQAKWLPPLKRCLQKWQGKQTGSSCGHKFLLWRPWICRRAPTFLFYWIIFGKIISKMNQTTVSQCRIGMISILRSFYFIQPEKEALHCLVEINSIRPFQISIWLPYPRRFSIHQVKISTQETLGSNSHNSCLSASWAMLIMPILKRYNNLLNQHINGIVNL